MDHKYAICVSGAAVTKCCNDQAFEKTKELGKEIVRQGGIVITGATTGVPLWAAQGAKEENGYSIGMSPANTKLEHVKKYKLPTKDFDIIIYSGFGYSGRNLLLTRSSDGVIVSCGRLGTLNEFTIAFEDKKPIGVLVGTGGTADQIKNIVEKGNRGTGKIVYDTDPKKLVEKLIELIELENKHAVPDNPYENKKEGAQSG
jgi:hypothetical protein